MKAVLIINPASGRSMITDYVGDILSLLRKNGYETETLMTRRKDDAKRFAQRCGEQAALLVCCGGDGTLSEVVNGVAPLQRRPRIAYIPTGTTNDFSKSMGLSADILRSLILLRRGVTKMLDVGRFVDRYFIYVASFGLFAESSYATTRALKRRFGHLAYVITGMKELVRLRSYRMRVTDAEGRVHEGDYIYGSVSNSTCIGGLMHFQKGVVDLQDGLHEVMLIRRPKNLREFGEIVRAVRTGHFDTKLITVFSAPRVTIESPTPIDWSLDGEHVRTEGAVVAENVPQAIPLIFPRDRARKRELIDKNAQRY